MQIYIKFRLHRVTFDIGEESFSEVRSNQLPFLTNEDEADISIAAKLSDPTSYGQINGTISAPVEMEYSVTDDQATYMSNHTGMRSHEGFSPRLKDKIKHLLVQLAKEPVTLLDGNMLAQIYRNILHQLDPNVKWWFSKRAQELIHNKVKAAKKAQEGSIPTLTELFNIHEVAKVSIDAERERVATHMRKTKPRLMHDAKRGSLVGWVAPSSDSTHSQLSGIIERELVALGYTVRRIDHLVYICL